MLPGDPAARTPAAAPADRDVRDRGDRADPRTLLTGELRALVRRHPRESWAGHANLGDLARFWLQRHAMFRELDQVIRQGTEAPLDGQADLNAFKPWLLRHLRWYLGQLEEHHQVEDLHYFPVFRRAEPRLVGGFELLERDHHTIHAAIETIVERANAVLAHQAVAVAEWRTELARLRDAHIELGRELGRHLDDEEDLIIPLILARGERALLGG